MDDILFDNQGMILVNGDVAAGEADNELIAELKDDMAADIIATINIPITPFGK